MGANLIPDYIQLQTLQLAVNKLYIMLLEYLVSVQKKIKYERNMQYFSIYTANYDFVPEFINPSSASKM